MLDRHETPRKPGRKAPPPSVLFAKFPPDDGDLPAAPPAGGGGGYADDGNFKRGRFSPVAILVAILLAVGGAAALYFGFLAEKEKMTVE